MELLAMSNRAVEQRETKSQAIKGREQVPDHATNGVEMIPFYLLQCPVYHKWRIDNEGSDRSSPEVMPPEGDASGNRYQVNSVVKERSKQRTLRNNQSRNEELRHKKTRKQAPKRREQYQIHFAKGVEKYSIRSYISD